MQLEEVQISESYSLWLTQRYFSFNRYCQKTDQFVEATNYAKFFNNFSYSFGQDSHSDISSSNSWIYRQDKIKNEKTSFQKLCVHQDYKEQVAIEHLKVVPSKNQSWRHFFKECGGKILLFTRDKLLYGLMIGAVLTLLIDLFGIVYENWNWNEFYSYFSYPYKLFRSVIRKITDLLNWSETIDQIFYGKYKTVDYNMLHKDPAKFRQYLIELKDKEK